MENAYEYLDVIYNCAEKHNYKLFRALKKELEGKVDDPVLFLCRRYDFVNEVRHDGLQFWRMIGREENLSEDFMREFQDKLNWLDLSCHQQMSESFVNEFIEKIDIRFFLMKHEDISDAFRNRLESIINPHFIGEKDTISFFTD